ncbi:MAG: hypothetical protein CMJ74_10980 [Planctomycetaceae bacterium]|nr:hypothetical protein [Planctomycetaceae bacterium]|tara:strand:- start:5755 stop:6729 length:975 start_codon:yes stop_codon:yes gene_type:complete
MESRFPYPTIVIVLLVAMRIAIGWYFFESGRSKNLDRDFSSAGFLSQAKGPLAPLYKSALPSNHQFDVLLAKARIDHPNPHPPGSIEWVEFEQEPYSLWQQQILFDFGRIRQQATNHFKLDEDDLTRADKVFAYYEKSLADYFRSARSDIAAYRHELARLENWESNDSASDVPYQTDRIAAKRKELASSAAQFQTAVDDLQASFQEELSELVPPEEKLRAGPLPVGSNTLASFDRFLMVSHFLIGGCMVIGLVSRFASLSAGLFLVTVIASQPPWIVGYSTIGYQVVMLIGCLLLTATPSGRWCGIDHFLPKMSLSSCCKPKGA